MKHQVTAKLIYSYCSKLMTFPSIFLSILCLVVSSYSTPASATSFHPRKTGAILFKLKPGVTLNALINRVAPASLIEANSNVEKIHASGIYEIEMASPVSFLNSVQKSEEQLAREFIATGLVEFAEPDYIHEPDSLPNDPKFSSQWYLQKIGTPIAWNVSTGNSKIQVLVCDTGIKANHQDLVGNVLTPGYNFADNTTDTEPTGNPHGTLVAGVIGANGNNGIGIAGINWNVQIIPGKISNDPKGGALTSSMVKCIQWAMDHKIRIVNLSYNANGSSAVDDASKELFNNNGLLFYTIGNSGQPVDFPKNPFALRIGATDGYDFKAYWSNSGEALDIVAPGSMIVSTDMTGDYKTVKGTSFSAPIVAGSAALLLSIDPTLTSTQLRNLLLDSADDLGDPGVDIHFGRGRLNLGRAASELQKGKPLQIIKPRAIYGKDDRQELYEQDAKWREIGRSLAGKVSLESIENKGNYWQLLGSALRKKECPGRFADQITVPHCTGFLIKPNVLVTAAHCMKTEDDCTKFVWVFEYALSNAGDTSANYTKVDSSRVFKCQKVLSRGYQDFGDIDYTIIELDRPVFDRKSLDLGIDLPLIPQQAVVNIGNSNGLPLKFKASANIIQMTPTNLAFDTNLDAFNGDSGSPVFDAETRLVIGITSRGNADHHHDGGTCRALKICNPGDKCHLSTASKISNLKKDPVFQELFQ